jgi:hypothetical protein
MRRIPADGRFSSWMRCIQNWEKILVSGVATPGDPKAPGVEIATPGDPNLSESLITRLNTYLHLHPKFSCKSICPILHLPDQFSSIFSKVLFLFHFSSAERHKTFFYVSQKQNQQKR